MLLTLIRVALGIMSMTGCASALTPQQQRVWAAGEICEKKLSGTGAEGSWTYRVRSVEKDGRYVYSGGERMQNCMREELRAQPSRQ